MLTFIPARGPTLHLAGVCVNRIGKEKALVVDALRAQLPVLMDHLNSSHGKLTHRLAQVAKVGKHDLEILLDRNSTGVRLEETTGQAIARAPKLLKQRFVPLLVAALIGILFLIWLAHR